MRRNTNNDETMSSQEEAECGNETLGAEHEYEEYEYNRDYIAPHSYPFWIKLFGLLLVVGWLWTVPYFIVYEISHHKDLYQCYERAESAFQDKDYAQALRSYQELLAKRPECRKSRLRLAEMFLTLDKHYESDDYSFYDTALFYLGDHYYSKEELLEVQSYLACSRLASFRKYMKGARR